MLLQRKANELGFKTEMLSMALKGEAREKGIELAKQFRYRIEEEIPLKKPMCSSPVERPLSLYAAMAWVGAIRKPH
jgi:hypothetical protein